MCRVLQRFADRDSGSRLRKLGILAAVATLHTRGVHPLAEALVYLALAERKELAETNGIGTGEDGWQAVEELTAKLGSITHVRRQTGGHQLGVDAGTVG